eukprot:TRINITY_DN64657_c0_g1_i1.p1 TRINITY_DN64657_c0_g1~~TRINITY_DN64657_c0_g1_i1.p1  ORF type:complete len:281 (-),score=46.45 TRINITY_DN64657_c0_g1_i1:198-1040(-)
MIQKTRPCRRSAPAGLRALRLPLLVLALLRLTRLDLWNLSFSFAGPQQRALRIRQLQARSQVKPAASGAMFSRKHSTNPTTSRSSVAMRAAGFDVSGNWGCYKTEGDIDAYWKATGLPWLPRKGFQLMEWGAGKNTNFRKFTQTGDEIKMEYSFDGPGLGGLGFTETYTVGKGVQQITRMGGAKIYVEPLWESESVLKVTNMAPDKQTENWAAGLVTGGKDKADADVANVESDVEEKAKGTVIDVHRFYVDKEDASVLILEADSTSSGGPVVKWFLRKSD